MKNLSKKNILIIEAFEDGYDINRKGYLVRKNGTIKSEFKLGKNGYLLVSLRLLTDSRGKVLIHKLQAYKKFGNRMFKEGIVVRHLDGNPLNNSWENIQIGTPTQNQMDITPEERKIHALKAIRKKQDSSRPLEKRYSIYKDIFEGKLTNKEIMLKHDISSTGTLWYMKNKSLEYNEYKNTLMM